MPQTAEALLSRQRQCGHTQAAEKRPSNRKGKKIYTDEAIASWPTFGITPAVREKLLAAVYRPLVPRP
jgi:hypothetical protein